MKSIVILISGRGSNMESLLNADTIPAAQGDDGANLCLFQLLPLTDRQAKPFQGGFGIE